MRWLRWVGRLNRWGGEYSEVVEVGSEVELMGWRVHIGTGLKLNIT